MIKMDGENTDKSDANAEKYRADDKEPLLPHYVDCNNVKIDVCDYLLTRDCPATCAYAIDVGGVGVSEEDKYSICKYFVCIVARETGKDCSEHKRCQTFKFYERYGTEPMWVGSIVRPGIIRELEKMCGKEVLKNEE